MPDLYPSFTCLVQLSHTEFPIGGFLLSGFLRAAEARVAGSDGPAASSARK